MADIDPEEDTIYVPLFDSSGESRVIPPTDWGKAVIDYVVITSETGNAGAAFKVNEAGDLERIEGKLVVPIPGGEMIFNDDEAFDEEE